MRWSALSVALCFVAILVSGKPNHASSCEHQSTAEKRYAAIIAFPHQYEPSAHATKSNDDSPKWYAAFKRPESWLVIAAFLTLIILIWQANEMRKATKAMRGSTAATERSVKLQETALRQWVDIENWRSVPFVPEAGVWSLHVQFDVKNPTNLPLTLNSVFIMFSAHGEPEQGGKIGRKNLIPPHKSHPVTTSVKITEEQFLKWEDLKELVFIVRGYVEFEDVLGELRPQPLSGVIACSKKNGVRFIPPYGAGLYITDNKEKDKNPN